MVSCCQCVRKEAGRLLSVWVGRAGSGKSRRVLETMEKNRGLRRQVLLVPEHISHEAEVDLCRDRKSVV